LSKFRLSFDFLCAYGVLLLERFHVPSAPPTSLIRKAEFEASMTILFRCIRHYLALPALVTLSCGIRHYPPPPLSLTLPFQPPILSQPNQILSRPIASSSSASDIFLKAACLEAARLDVDDCVERLELPVCLLDDSRPPSRLSANRTDRLRCDGRTVRSLSRLPYSSASSRIVDTLELLGRANREHPRPLSRVEWLLPTRAAGSKTGSPLRSLASDSASCSATTSHSSRLQRQKYPGVTSSMRRSRVKGG